MSTTIIIPTRNRQQYLLSTVASIVAQIKPVAAQIDVVIVDDEPSAKTAAIAKQFAIHYIAHPRSLGPNAARNSAIAASESELLIFVDDDIEVGSGWLQAFLHIAAANPAVDVFAGRILARIESHRPIGCGRENQPVTTLDLGQENQPTRYGWSANLAVRQRAFTRAGLFNAELPIYGDEEEWQDRHLASGGKTLYVADATVYHRRINSDARLRSLTHAAYHRGKAAQRYDQRQKRAPARSKELETLAGCLSHTLRYRCQNGIPMSAHSLGRLYNTYFPTPTANSDPDFLSGESGTVGGKRRLLRKISDQYFDLKELPQRRHTVHRARACKPNNVLVLGIEREGMLMQQIRAELLRSHHHVDVFTCPAGNQGKFENLNSLLHKHPTTNYDWVIVTDDDIELPADFLDGFLYLCQQTDLRIAQPAHKLDSHAAWRVTRRDHSAKVRETHFVEIGPFTAFHQSTFAELLPFPALKMGWGLDCHWGAVAQQQGWRIGVVDLFPIAHRIAPAGANYDRKHVIAEAKDFLEVHPYVTRSEARWSRKILK